MFGVRRGVPDHYLHATGRYYKRALGGAWTIVTVRTRCGTCRRPNLMRKAPEQGMVAGEIDATFCSSRHLRELRAPTAEFISSGPVPMSDQALPRQHKVAKPPF